MPFLLNVLPIFRNIYNQDLKKIAYKGLFLEISSDFATLG